jgi:predicted nucleic acid-binding protein
MLSYEIDESPHERNKEHISQFVDEYSSFHVGEKQEDEVLLISAKIMKTGIHYKDSVHLACSIIAGCDYFITTDKHILKYKSEKIKIVDPIQFVKIWRELE